MDATVSAGGPLDPAGTLARFRLRGEDPANRLSAGVFRRAVEVEGQWHGYEVGWRGGGDDVELMVSMSGRSRARVMDAALSEIRHIFALDLDVSGFYRSAATDPVLGELVAKLYGLRPTLAPLPFEMLVSSVCAQQVNLTFAFAVRRRLVERFGTPVKMGGGITVYGFPSPQVVARAQVAELRAMQLTTRKAEYIIGLARQVADGALDLSALRERSNDDVIAALTAVRGFGRWSAEWFLARGLGRGDVCPAGDLGVRKAFEHFYGRGRSLSERAIRRRAARWGPHQNLAVHYLLAGARTGSPAAGGGT
jgi:DNA-3-methyladenine glycosylase II